ncbi:hypothetical protein O9992_22595 [Vibrio lentus]|nr:hypothetical protein [Vibrio lentus]
MNKGTSYNSYLIREEKTVLAFDVPLIIALPNNLLQTLRWNDINEIDYIICQHAEEDHSGALQHY